MSEQLSNLGKAGAEEAARELGIDVMQSLITISQQFDNGLNWRVNYGPRDYLNRRGGDLMIEVSGEDMKIKQVLRLFGPSVH